MTSTMKFLSSFDSGVQRCIEKNGIVTSFGLDQLQPVPHLPLCKHASMHWSVQACLPTPICLQSSSSRRTTTTSTNTISTTTTSTTTFACVQACLPTPLCLQTPKFSRQASVAGLQAPSAWVVGLCRLQDNLHLFLPMPLLLLSRWGATIIAACIGDTLSNPTASFAEKPPCFSSMLQDQPISTIELDW